MASIWNTALTCSLLLSATYAHADRPDPVTVSSPGAGTTWVLGQADIDVAPSPYLNAKKYDCAVSQGHAKWKQGPQQYPSCKLSVADQKKFKAGEATVAVRAFVKGHWLAPATATFTFEAAPADAPPRHGGGGDLASVKKDSAVALAAATKEVKAACGCSIPLSVDWASYPAPGDAKLVGEGIGSVSGALKDQCERDNARKQFICKNVTAGRVDYVDPRKRFTASFKGGVAVCMTNADSYCGSDLVSRQLDNPADVGGTDGH